MCVFFSFHSFPPQNMSAMCVYGLRLISSFCLLFIETRRLHNTTLCIAAHRLALCLLDMLLSQVSFARARTIAQRNLPGRINKSQSKHSRSAYTTCITCQTSIYTSTTGRRIESASVHLFNNVRREDGGDFRPKPARRNTVLRASARHPFVRARTWVLLQSHVVVCRPRRLLSARVECAKVVRRTLACTSSAVQCSLAPASADCALIRDVSAPRVFETC